MRMVVLTDVHANLPALRAALQAIRAAVYDAIFHTGDAIGIGPFPAETLDLLLTTPRLHGVMGNHDGECQLRISSKVRRQEVTENNCRLRRTVRSSRLTKRSWVVGWSQRSLPKC